MFLFIAAVAVLVACGGEEKEIPKEERGEPNVLPEEIILYREAREAFREWVQIFDPDRRFEAAYTRLSKTSRSKLKQEGVSNPASFEKWFAERSNADLAPFNYTFSRFDILDIEILDSTMALLTGTFLVDVRGSTFESVGTFRLRRQGGRWVVPFMESGDFESSWWQKERQFSSRVREEGSSTYTAQAIGLSLRYPITWDIGGRSTVLVPSYGSSLPGFELTYVDPSSLLPQALLRIGILHTPVSDSLLALASKTEASSPVIVRQEAITLTEQAQMTGKTYLLADALNNRHIVVLAVVDEKSSFQFFSQTFESIISSIVSNKAPPQ